MIFLDHRAKSVGGKGRRTIQMSIKASPAAPQPDKGSFQKTNPQTVGITSESAARMLVNAMGPVESAIKPVCMETARHKP